MKFCWVLQITIPSGSPRGHKHTAPAFHHFLSRSSSQQTGGVQCAVPAASALGDGSQGVTLPCASCSDSPQLATTCAYSVTVTSAGTCGVSFQVSHIISKLTKIFKLFCRIGKKTDRIVPSTSVPERRCEGSPPLPRFCPQQQPPVRSSSEKRGDTLQPPSAPHHPPLPHSPALRPALPPPPPLTPPVAPHAAASPPRLPAAPRLFRPPGPCQGRAPPRGVFLKAPFRGFYCFLHIVPHGSEAREGRSLRHT